MPKVSLSTMDVQSLMDLRKQVDELVLKRRADIETQLGRIASLAGERAGLSLSKRRGGSTLRGRKVPPKYRGPSGETWAGRGARPRWLVAAIKDGKKLDDFLIDKSSRRGRKKKRRSKR
jgi:DNA-binding protein H-NS